MKRRRRVAFYPCACALYLLTTLLPLILIVLPTVLLCFPLVMPFHCWLPRTAVASALVTALIYSVAAVHTAVIALIKIGSYVYGYELLALLNDGFWSTGWLIYLCGVTAIYTAWRAYRTTDLKQRFSFSTAGHLSYVITATLVGTPQSILGGTLHMVTHSFTKLNLFFIAGLFTSLLGAPEASVIARWVPRKRWIAAAAALSGLSIAGIPLLAGYYSKDLMLIEELYEHHYAVALFLVWGA